MGWLKIEAKRKNRNHKGVRVSSKRLMGKVNQSPTYLTCIYIADAVMKELGWSKGFCSLAIGDGAQAGHIKVEPSTSSKEFKLVTAHSKSSDACRVQFAAPIQPQRTIEPVDVVYTAHADGENALILSLPPEWRAPIADSEKIVQPKKEPEAEPPKPTTVKAVVEAIKTMEQASPGAAKIHTNPQQSDFKVGALKDVPRRPVAQEMPSKPPARAKEPPRIPESKPSPTEPPPSWRGTGAQREDGPAPLKMSGQYILVYGPEDRFREIHRARLTKQAARLAEVLIRDGGGPVSKSEAIAYIAAREHIDKRESARELQFYIDDVNLNLVGYARILVSDEDLLSFKFTNKVMKAA